MELLFGAKISSGIQFFGPVNIDFNMNNIVVYLIYFN
jgi:hypothetical protein